MYAPRGSPGAKENGSTFETTNHPRQFCAGGLQMTLHTNIHLEFRSQTRRVYDGGSDLRCLRFTTRGEFDVPRPGTMTPLAIDTLRKLSVSRRITVVTEQAALVRDPREIRRRNVIVAGTHGPTRLLRVPRDRQFRQFPCLPPVQEGARVIARADREMRLQFENIRLASARIQLVPALVDSPIAAKYLIVAAGSFMKKMIIAGVIFDAEASAAGPNEWAIPTC